MSSLKVSYKDPAELRRRDRNPRTHTPNQIKQIAASIKEFGFINPVLIAVYAGLSLSVAPPRRDLLFRVCRDRFARRNSQRQSREMKGDRVDRIKIAGAD